MVHGLRQRRLGRWTRLIATALGSMFLAGCGSEPGGPPSHFVANGDSAHRAALLQPCSAPALQPVERASNTTVAVNYPVEELQRPTRLARPFPLTDPRSPLPFITIPRPSIRGVQAAPDAANRRGESLSAAGPRVPMQAVEPLPPIADSAAVEPLPPIETTDDVEPLPEIEPLPEVGPLPEVELPGELPLEAAPAPRPQQFTRPNAVVPPIQTDQVATPPAPELGGPRMPIDSANGPRDIVPPGAETPQSPLPTEPHGPIVLPAPAAGAPGVAPPASGTARSPFPTDVETQIPDLRPPAPGLRTAPHPLALGSSSMQAVARQAQQTIQHGYELGGRGALYSARAEFILALRTVAQALDLQSASRRHSQALSAGLKALEEAEHFVPQGSRLEADLDLGAIVRAHRTPVCKDLSEDQLLPVLVLQRYYTYAGEQLTAAGGGEEAASMALFGLGKTYTALASQQHKAIVAAEPKAMVFHQAALSTDPGNFLAANELAVLVAQYGQYATARALLQYSVSILPHSSVWKNLAAVHQRLGEQQLAQAAEREATAAARREATAKLGNRDGIIPSSEITWVDPATFAGKGRQTVEWQRPATMSAADAKPAPPDRSARKAWSGWWR